MVRTAALSEAATPVVPRRWRLRLVFFLVRMWRRYARPRLIPPFARFLKRFAAPRLVFNFGIVQPLLILEPPATACAAPAAPERQVSPEWGALRTRTATSFLCRPRFPPRPWRECA